MPWWILVFRMARADEVPAAGSAWREAGSLFTARAEAEAVVEPGGRVWVIGGLDRDGQPVASTERLDDRYLAWHPGGNLRYARVGHSATVDATGRTVVIGGLDTSWTPRAEVERAESNGWTTMTALHEARAGHATVLRDDGSLMVSGGRTLESLATASVEVVDVDRGATSHIAPLGTARQGHVAAGFAGGRVVVAGGDSADGEILRSTEIFDGSTWIPGPDLPEPRARAIAIPLRSGCVLVAGGVTTGEQPLSTLAIFDGLTWSSLPAPIAAVDAATTLPDGRVLFAGASGAARWDPEHGTFDLLSPLLEPRADAAWFALPDGRVLVEGGRTEAGTIDQGVVLDAKFEAAPATLAR